jgi:hypothetical protein
MYVCEQDAEGSIWDWEREESAQNCIMRSFLISALRQLLFWQPYPGQWLRWEHQQEWKRWMCNVCEIEGLKIWAHIWEIGPWRGRQRLCPKYGWISTVVYGVTSQNTAGQHCNALRACLVAAAQTAQNKVVLFRRNPTTAYNHQHPSMAKCFGIF